MYTTLYCYYDNQMPVIILQETMGFITWLVFLSMILPLSTATWLYEIHVNRQNGINDTSCWEGGYSTPCLSLNLALKGVQHYNDSVTIILQPGRHQLQNSRETLLKNISRLAIVGNNSEGEVVIQCQPLTGLAFFGCKNITIQNVTIVSCGMLQNSTILKEDSVFQWVQVAILFSACEIVQIENVLFTESNGTGVVINNPVGVVQLDMCTFSHNFLSSEQAHDHEGGGLVIETNSSQSNCTISNCTFVNNTASALDLSIPSRGGGISIVFRGEAASNTIQINNVYLVDNKALFGGGIFLAFYDNAHGNSITIDGLILTKNYAMVKVGTLLSLLHSSGGGIAINFAASDVDYPLNNTVEINNGEFVSNAAQLGGGLAVIVTAHFNISAGNTLLIENCTFDHNIAYGKGSSAYFLNRKTSFLNTTVSNGNFTNGACWENTGARLLCLGSLVMSNFSLTFKGTLLFSSNSLSALSLRSSSSIELYPSTKLKFINNNGLDGGAINIIECSSIIVNNSTELYFENNTASHYGGAIYAEACSKTEGDCFIRHSNRAMSPNEWNTSFSFYGNQASSASSSHRNSIYTDSMLSCVWPDYNKDETFCWKEWSFWYAPQFSVSFIRDNCLNQLRSGPAYINSTGITKDLVYPGQCINLEQFINVYDDYDNVLYPTNLKAGLLFGASRLVSDPQDCQCINPVYDDLCGILHESSQPCSSNQVALLSVSCNESYANHTSKILVHLPNQLYGVVVELIFNQCDKGSYCNATGSCFRPNPPVYKSVCSNTSSFIKSPECDDTIICGSCAEDQNVSIVYNSPLFACMKCDDAFPGVAFYMLEIFLVLVMMTVLAVFHINITNGNLNAYILYSQMLTLQFPGLTYSAWTAIFHNSSNFINASFIVYSIWNLSFLSWYPFPICIPKLQTAVEVIILQYIVASLPLLFIIVSYIWIKWYSNGYRLVVYTTRPVHRLLARFWQKFKIQPSLIDTYAGLLLLAYMRFLAVSVKLLQFVTIDQTLSYSALLSLAQAITLVLVAIVCLLVFVILPMAVLLLYPFMIFQRCLTCCKLDRPGLHALVDAYQGCFKNSATDDSEMRYFAGLYLLFRFCYVAILVFPLSTLKYHDTANNAAYYDIALPVAEACLGFLLAGLVLLLRPYKNIAHNMIDFLTLFFMTLLLNFIGLFLLPFFILLIYTIFRVLKSCCCCACKTRNASDDEAAVPAERQPLLAPALPTRSEVAFDNENELYPDRICNPDGYNKYNQYRPLSELHSQ